jgi:hypothetical protein
MISLFKFNLLFFLALFMATGIGCSNLSTDSVSMVEITLKGNLVTEGRVVVESKMTINELVRFVKLHGGFKNELSHLYIQSSTVKREIDIVRSFELGLENKWVVEFQNGDVLHIPYTWAN